MFPYCRYGPVVISPVLLPPEHRGSTSSSITSRFIDPRLYALSISLKTVSDLPYLQLKLHPINYFRTYVNGVSHDLYITRLRS